MRHGLHHAAVQPERGLDQRLAVAGGARARHGGVRVFVVEFRQELAHGGQRIALVGHVGGLEQVELLVDHHGLDGSGAGVYADVHPAVVAGAGHGLHPRLFVPRLELGVFAFIPEQRRAGVVAGLPRPGANARDQRVDVHRRGSLHGRAQRHGVQRVLRMDAGDAQRLVEAVPQLAEESQRPAQVHHVAGDLAPLREARDGLPGHGLEYAAGNVLLLRALVQQGLDVGFGENAAAGRDGVAALVVLRQRLQLLHGHVHQRGHLVDERAGAAGAGAVHAHLQAARARQEQDLGVLAAQLNGRVGLGHQLAQRHAGGVNLLQKVDIQFLGQAHAGGAGDAHFKTLPRILLRDGVQQHLAEHGDLRAVPLIAAKYDLPRVVEHHGLDGGRADVQSNFHKSTPNG